MKHIVSIADHIISPLGEGSAQNFDAVLAGRTALRRHDGVFGVPEPFVASLLGERGTLPGLSFFETLLLRAASKVISDAGIDPAGKDVIFIFSAIKGNVESIEDGEDAALLGRSAVRIAEKFGNPNTPIVVSNACISGVCALIEGMRALACGRYSHAVIVGCEVQSRFIVSGFQCLKALSAEACRPFDAARTGLNLGEAAAAMVLGAVDRPEKGQWELVEGAVRNDANHISGPSRTGEGSYNCLDYVLAKAERDDLAFINVHGTATLYNDEMESFAIERAGLSDVPLNALKGYYGHTMGAAGILETIISMKAADAGVVIGTKGFGTLGVTHPVNVSAQHRPTDRKSFIKLLSGFGGCNAALLCRRHDGTDPLSEYVHPSYRSTGRVTLSSKDTDLASLYRDVCGDYPKFFKMDTLCKTGFLAAELLLKGFPGRFSPRKDVAVAVFTKHGPYCNDTHYQATITDPENYFPSPSLFVYTLANIVTGEIAIRNKFLGESSAYILDRRDDAVMESVIAGIMSDRTVRCLVAGWIDCTDDGTFEADFKLIEKQ